MLDNIGKNIHFAKIRDVPEILELVKDIPEEYGLDKNSPVDIEKTKQSLIESIENQTCVISRKNGTLVSILKLSFASDWWSNKTFIFNDILYFKQGKLSLKLLKEYIEFMENIKNKFNGIPFYFSMINYIINGKNDIDKKEKLFLKLFKNSNKTGTVLEIL